MLRNLHVIATDIFGAAHKFKGDDGQTTERTFCWLIVNALSYEVDGEAQPGNPITAAVKIERFILATRLREAIGKDEDVELSEREVAFIKTATAPKYPTFVIGPLFQLLEAK